MTEQNLFRGLNFVNATELGLGGNAAASDLHRLKWNKKDSPHGERITLECRGSTSSRAPTIELQNLEELSFVICL